MRAELTPAVTRALQSAQEWACLLGHPELRPAHVLLGLLQEEEGRPSLLLAGAGLERTRVHDLLAAGRAVPPPLAEASLPQNSRVQAILRSALTLAREVFAE